MNLNSVFTIGRAGDQPQLKSAPNGNSVASFSIATTRTWKDKAGQKQQETEWHKIVLWGKLAEIAANYVTKGALVFIQGRIATRKWTDKQGIERQSTEIVADRIELGPKPQATRPEALGSPDDEDFNADELPF